MIVCCGEALIDMLPRTLPDGAGVLLPVPGGALFNTSVALGRLGAPAGYFGGLSTDLFGERLAAQLASSGVDISLCPRSLRPTTLAFVELVDGSARYTFYDEGTAGRCLAEADLPALPDAATALHFGAISLAQEPCGGAFEALFHREAAGRVVSLDPNIRPGFIKDEDAYRARLGRMFARADIIKLSDEDIAWIAAGEAEDALVDRWLAGGASLVVITAGAEGACGRLARDRVEIAARPSTVVDTVGAGDAFTAGLLAGLDRRGLMAKDRIASLTADDLSEAMDLAATVSAIVVSRAGADPPWQDEI